MSPTKEQQIEQELTLIKQRLSVLEEKFNIQTNTFSPTVCIHEFEQSTAGHQCKKCGKIIHIQF